MVWYLVPDSKVRCADAVKIEAHAKLGSAPWTLESAALHEKRKRNLDGRIEALKKTKPTPPVIDLFAPDETAPPLVTSIKNHPHHPALQESQDDNDASEAPRAANSDTMAAIVGRSKAVMAAANDTREADALYFAGNSTHTELKKTKKAKSSSSSSSRLEQLRRERAVRESVGQRRLETLLRR
ncbi:hypothetical protein SPRG_16213 [Saprolegnia parasitica CBS 223.65]|uniref:Uncharacterized protein n=1 Tax=Saprolegnia parasitica (strain CBS 223.65) TaxID=695850 RepID=A0A067BVQ9_SAPPC|nr:hypothetical protein SPRG_16213 [Saprolegnia parasitica CBS 223.65]KDO18381.1 hypothetical protein SPRG_16213 [Saprolegnia parasitica CBS 223.65]|eukprot:XP_012210911.1 hypothetical protein SPRG_16213 [Saprolegnia parasitica CBS 223.65]